jgi:hypothetical protein
MSQHLPEELENWPSDAWAVLGVSHSADAKSIKRAYTQILKRFKPEQSPQHFQRLREAYDHVQQFLAWRDKYTEFNNSAEPTETVPANTNGNAPEQLASSNEEKNFPIEEIPVATLVPEINVLKLAWEEITNGKTQEPYARLVKWHKDLLESEPEPRPSHGQGYAQAYWLLTLHPLLDKKNSAFDWICIGLQRSGNSWQLLELLEREIDRHPPAVFEPPFLRCLETATAPVLVRLLVMRWKAAERLQRREIIFSEVEKYRNSISFDEPSGWAILLMTALECNVFNDAPPFVSFKPYLEEIETLPQEEIEERLHRWDILLQLAQQWAVFLSYKMPPTWKTLLQLTCCDSQFDYYIAIQKVVAEVAEYPIDAMKAFDRILERCRPAAVLMFAMLSNYCYQRGVRFKDDAPLDHAPLIPQALRNSFTREPYTNDMSAELLQFCLNEAITPLQAAALLEGVSAVKWSHFIAQDSSVQLIYGIWLAFWSDLD